MMRKTFFAIILTFVTFVCVDAQTRLVGRLISVEEQAIEGATITLANQSISTTTNAEGQFSLTYLEAIDEEVIIEAYGYMSDILLVQLVENQTTDLGNITLQPDLMVEMKEEVVLNLAEMDLNDDEGKSQSMASASSASQDVFNSTISYAWSNARYRGRGYEQIYEQNYIEGISFNSAERGQFNFSAMGGLNDATRYREVVEGIEANNFTFGSLGLSTNYLQSATNYAQGWKVGLAGTNRNYKGAARATYSSGLMENGWAFTAQLAWRYTPYIDVKGQIGEGIAYNSFGYFLTAEKQWGKDKRLSLITFGAPTRRGQSAAVTQETYDLTNQYNKTSWGHNNYNPYWGYQDGKVRNSRIVETYDPTVIASFDWQIDEDNFLKAGVGYHYSMYSNSALTFYNAPDPRPDYYRNMPSFLFDGQIDKDGYFIGKDMNGKPLGAITDGGYIKYPLDYNGIPVGHSINLDTYAKLTELWTSRDDDATQINWDALYAANYANNNNNPAGSARYIVERRHNDIQEGMINLNYRNTSVEHLTITAGLEAKGSQGIHYKTIDDLLGGKQWIDVDPFAERDIKELATNIGLTQADITNVKQNDLRNPNATIKENGRFGYDYRINMVNAKIWAQNEWNWNHIDLYYALQFSYSSMQRTTDMLNGRAWYLAKLGEQYNHHYYYLANEADNILASTISNNLSILPSRLAGYAHHFIDPAFKIGATYKIDGRNQLKINALAETRAPLARDAYISPRVHDRAVETIYHHDYARYYAQQNGTSWLKEYYGASQKIVGGDLTYNFNYPLVRGRVTGFFTQFWNGTELNGYYDDEARTFVNQSLTGISRRHMGVEAAAAVKLGLYFTLTGVLSVGDYRYTNNAYAITSAENGMALAENVDGPIYELRDSVLIKGLRVSTGPQVNSSLKLSFFHPDMWFADITVNYFDWSYLDYAPARRMKGLFTGVRADGSAVNGWYGDTYTNAIEKDEAGNIVYDQYGVPELKYPYSLLSNQEMLTASNPLHRFLVDVSVGKLIYLKDRQSISINLTVNNILNNTHFKTGGYQQARLPRQTRQGVDDRENSVISPNAWKFPAKYYYAWGTNFYLNIQYKF
ncbi:MAG: carboxypeptidase-like regulatory domain-containing protein [Paludibacteraceae bacterium]|nr:carboxypeptidase-like regulatory domain-containing protein [Paludibacteraceae bacterium]